MRPRGTAKQLEKRRLEAVRLLESGRNTSEVARQIGCAKSSVCRWMDSYQRQGLEGLRPVPIPGRPCRLSPAQKRRLERRLLAGALRHGYRTDVWMLERIAALIRKPFQVQYHPNHVWWLLRGMGWSSQRPERRALQRDEQAIAKWTRYKWPQIKKG